MSTDLGNVADTGYQAIREACRQLPPPQGNYHTDDYVENLQLTVLDYQLKSKTIEKAIKHFKDRHGKTITSHDALQTFLDEHPDDGEAATELWGNQHWKRLGQLRTLMKFFAGLSEPVNDQNTLREWPHKSDFERDFRGRVPGLAVATYKWLTMRVGVSTIKPDVHVHRFLKNAANRTLSNREAIAVLHKVAAEIKRPAHELDWSIWEHQKSMA